MSPVESDDERTGTPLLSVVVPIYNVEPYLAACLRSIEGQAWAELEVVLVDDGSTDRSAAIADSYAARHPTWQVLRTTNVGMGAARNLGVRHAHGTYLGFVDADDMVPAYAYKLLVSTLEESGSDFVVGSMQRLENGAVVDARWLRFAHDERRLGTTVEQFPQIMANVFAWTKVFRRSFYDEAGLSFPEGVRYEDQVASIEAYLRARAFDVVRRPVYHWRIRADGTSVTQRRHEIDDLRDRLTTKHMTTELVRTLGSPALLDFWAHNGLAGDLPKYFEQIPGCDDDYWDLLQRGVVDLFRGLPPVEESRLRPPQRLVGWLVTAGRRSDAETVLAWLAEHRGPLPTRQDGEDVVAVLPFLDDPGTGIPREAFRMR